MKIIHFSLGLPPYRSGGLTKYSTDLMISQAERGVDVVLLYPGSFALRSSIQSKKAYCGIRVFELRKPTPVPLLGGVKEPLKLIPKKNPALFSQIKRFLTREQPDILHLHTLMGLPEGLIELAKAQGVKVCYTTHDYYGICLRVNLIDRQGVVCTGASPSKCAQCNSTGNSVLKMNIMNFKPLHRFKTQIRRLQRQPNQEIQTTTDSLATNREKEYADLLNYYKKMFSQVDLFLYNSSVSQAIYEQFAGTHKGQYIPISHKGIQFSVKSKHTVHNPIRFLYIGSADPYKGLGVLTEVLDQIYENSNQAFHLEVWGTTVSVNKNYATVKGFYSSEEQLKTILTESDLLICPSICYETFGFVVAESLSKGIPTLVSNTVGSKDIVHKIDPNFIFTSPNDLRIKLSRIIRNTNILIDFQEKLRDVLSESIEMEKHTEILLSIYSQTLLSAKTQ